MSETNFDYESDLLDADRSILCAHCKATLLRVSSRTVLGIIGKLTCPKCGSVTVYQDALEGLASTLPLSTACSQSFGTSDSEA